MAAIRRQQASALQNIAIIYSLQGDHTRALNSFTRVLAIYQDAKDLPKVALTQHNIGYMEMRQGNYAASLLHYQEALRLRGGLEDRQGLAETRAEIGYLESLQGRPGNARNDLEAALAVAQENKSLPLIVQIKTYIADLQLQTGDAGAAASYDEAIQLAEALRSPAAVMTAERGRGEAAMLAGKPSEALLFADKAAAAARSMHDPEAEWRAESLGGEALRAQNNLPAARDRYQRAVTIVETQRLRIAGGDQERRRYFEQSVFPYQALVGIALSGGDTWGALLYAENAHARVLREILDRSPLPVEGSMTAEEREAEKTLRTDLSRANTRLLRARKEEQAGLERELSEAQIRHSVFLGQVFSAHPELRALRAESAPLTRTDVDALVPDAKTAILEYVTTDDGTELFILTSQGISAVRVQASRSQLERQIGAFRKALADRDPGFQNPARKLYSLLLGPASRQLASATRIIVVPDGPLWDLPFSGTGGQCGPLLDGSRGPLLLAIRHALAGFAKVVFDSGCRSPNPRNGRPDSRWFRPRSRTPARWSEIFRLSTALPW